MYIHSNVQGGTWMHSWLVSRRRVGTNRNGSKTNKDLSCEICYHGCPLGGVIKQVHAIGPHNWGRAATTINNVWSTLASLLVVTSSHINLRLLKT